MPVQLRQKRNGTGRRRSRYEAPRDAVRGAPTTPARTGPSLPAPAQVPASAIGSCRGRPANQSLTGDRALYACGCGYAFHAPVSTSVGCPHCGDTQAW